MALVDRTTERTAVEEILHRAASGGSGALLLRGEPGVGKTTLLERARGQADGFRVLAARGVESEADLPFAGLYALLNGLVGEHLEDLPHPEAGALAAALGLEERDQPDRFAVAATTLWLLAQATDDRPDAHRYEPLLLGRARALGWLAPSSRGEEELWEHCTE